MSQHSAECAKTEILAHLKFITARWHELGEPCDLVLRSYGENLTPLHARFGWTPSELDRAAQWGVDVGSRDGRNIYPIINPVRPGGDAGSDEDVIASFFHWADADAEEAVSRLSAWAGPKWRLVVITGTTPTKRVHVYWELAEPTRDMAAWRHMQQRIAAQFSSDASVINPSRIMKLAGTVSWPNDRKRARGYIPETAVARYFTDRPRVDLDAFSRAFSGSPQPAQREPGGFTFDTGEHGRRSDDELTDALRRCSIDGQKHTGVRDVSAILAARGADRVAVEFIIRNVCPVWDANVENLIDSAFKKFAPPLYTPDENRPDRASDFFPASDFEGVIVPAREWHVPDLIPGRQVTMLGGDGGTGKSLLLQQLAVSTALGRSWIGQEVSRPGPVVLISAEDDRDELHRRIADIAEAEAAAFSDLHNLILRSLAGEDALLATLDRKSNALVATPLFAELDELLGDVKPTMLGLDTLSDLHSGEENSRAHARQFIGMIRGLAIRHQCAVVLLAHPSLTGMSTGTGMSGSTAWNNSVRSRLYLERVKDEDGTEPNPDARILSGKKANYARAGAEIMLTWRDGVFVSDTPAPVTGLDRMAASAKAERVFLRLLREFTDQGRYVSASFSPTYAPKVFAASPNAEGCTKRALVAAMEALFAKGIIRVSTHGKGAKSRSHIVYGSETE